VEHTWFTSATLWIKQICRAGNCNFPADTANFQRNSNKQLQVNFQQGTQSVNFAHKSSQNRGFSFPNVAFLDKYFLTGRFSNSPKFRRAPIFRLALNIAAKGGHLEHANTVFIMSNCCSLQRLRPIVSEAVKLLIYAVHYVPLFLRTKAATAFSAS